MKITRAMGLLLFLYFAQFILSETFQSFFAAANAVFDSIQAAAIISEQNLYELKYQ